MNSKWSEAESLTQVQVVQRKWITWQEAKNNTKVISAWLADVSRMLQSLSLSLTPGSFLSVPLSILYFVNVCHWSHNERGNHVTACELVQNQDITDPLTHAPETFTGIMRETNAAQTLLQRRLNVMKSASPGSGHLTPQTLCQTSWATLTTSAYPRAKQKQISLWSIVVGVFAGLLRSLLRFLNKSRTHISRNARTWKLLGSKISELPSS